MRFTWPSIRNGPLEIDFMPAEEGDSQRDSRRVHLIEDHAAKAQIPLRFAASKVMEGDQTLLKQLELTENEERVLEEIAGQTEEETGMDRRPLWPRCGSTILRRSAAMR